MSDERKAAFDKARGLSEAEKADEALEAIAEYTNVEAPEYTVDEMQTLNICITEKVTSAGFDDKKDACNQCIELLDGVKLMKDSLFLGLYCESMYEVFSKMSRAARDEEREQVWNKCKELFYELTLAAKKVWRDKNMPDGLTIYLNFAKLCKSYLDVADEDSFKMCESMAQEAKFLGKGQLEDEDWKDANKMIETIKKTIADARHDKELIDDSS